MSKIDGIKIIYKCSQCEKPKVVERSWEENEDMYDSSDVIKTDSYLPDGWIKLSGKICLYRRTGSILSNTIKLRETFCSNECVNKFLQSKKYTEQYDE